MEYIVCNFCGSSPQKKTFFITTCSHVICDSCVPKPPDFCKTCKIPQKIMKLDGNLPKNVKKLFSDPGSMMSDFHKRLQKSMSFQKYQKGLQMKIESKKIAAREEQTVKFNQKTQEMCQMGKKLGKIEEVSRKKVKDALAENERLEKLLKKLEGRQSSPAPEAEGDIDFFMKGSPTNSTPSLTSSTGSRNDDDAMFDFDLLGLERSSSLDRPSSSNSSQSIESDAFF